MTPEIIGRTSQPMSRVIPDIILCMNTFSSESARKISHAHKISVPSGPEHHRYRFALLLACDIAEYTAHIVVTMVSESGFQALLEMLGHLLLLAVYESAAELTTCFRIDLPTQSPGSDSGPQGPGNPGDDGVQGGDCIR